MKTAVRFKLVVIVVVGVVLLLLLLLLPQYAVFEKDVKWTKIWPQIGASENCEKIDWLHPFNGTNNFTCTSNGYYANVYDETCRQYYVCVKNSEAFIMIYLTCPKGTNFDSDINDCSSDYTCPYLSTTTQPTTQENSTTTEITYPVLPAGCIYESEPNYFSCSSSGSYPNYNDPTCRSYFYCIVVVAPILVIETKYSCEQNAYFNPETQTCEKGYVCPCNSNNSASNTTTVSNIIESSTEKRTGTTSSNEEKITPNETTSISTTKFSTEPTLSSSINAKPTTVQVLTTSKNSTNEEINQKTSTSESTTSPFRTSSTKPVTTTSSSTVNSTDLSSTIDFDECSYHTDTSYFICTEKGRFRNANDRTCQTYFLCNVVISSGRVIQTKYTCPTNSLFNPQKKLCDTEYTCPCISQITKTTTVATTTSKITTEEESTTSENFTSDETSSESTTRDLTTSSNSNYSTNKETTQENSTSESTTSPSRTPSTAHNTATASDAFNNTQTSPTTSFDECSYNADTSYFICTEKGRFRNANDNTCQTYFLCNILSSGRVIQTKYTCPTNSLFNPKKKLCDVEYTCPCQSEITSASTDQTTDNEVVTKEDSAITQSVTTEVTNSESTTDELTTSSENSNSTTDKETTQENSTSESSTSPSRTPSTGYNTATASDVFNGTEKSPTTSFDECAYNADTSYFICTEKGRFRNANDKTCQTYFLCNILSSGRVIQTKYTCPTNSLFNPKKKLCDVEYTCPCQSEITSASTVQTTDNEVVTKEDSTVTQSVTTEETNSESTTDELTTSSENSNSSTDKETTQENSTTESTTSPSRTPSTGHNTATASEAFNGTETSPTTSFDECASNADTSYFICTEKGRFRNANDKTCQTYFLCNILSSGRVIQTKYTCPTNSLFNPKKKLCDVEYTCPCQSEITSASTVQTTDNEVVTKEDSTVTQSVTTEVTNSESTTDELTTSSENSNSSTDKETTQENSTSESTASPSRTPSTGHNTATASEAFNGTETSPTTSFDECASNADTSYFICTEKGRFRNANDKTCQTYFLCNILSSGRVIQTKYTCPTNSLFNPKKKLCDIEYTCPCQSEITSASIVQTTDNEVVTKEDSTVTQSVTTEETNSESTTDELTTSSENSNSITDKETTQENSTSESTTSPSRTPSTGHNTATASEAFNVTETSPTTSFDECAYNADTSYFICTEKGRFRNANDNTCQTYFLCNILSSGRVIQTKYTCPINSLFNPKKKLCDIEYTCPCQSEITSASTVQTTDNEVVTKDDSTVTQSVTTEETNSESTTDELTTSSENSNSSTDKETTQENSTSERTTSPSRTASTGHNTATASESFNGTETSPTTSFDECASNADTSYFICTEKGRFRNANDKTCQTYFLCNILSSGRVIQTKYTCPTNSLFNPKKKLCDAEYTCPCQSEITSASTVQTTDNEVVTKEDSTVTQSVTTEETNSKSTTDELTTSSENSNSSTDKETTQENSTSESTTSPSRTPSTGYNTATASDVFNGTEKSPTTSFDECAYNADTSYFICTEKGRFRNANDKTCQTYFLCNILSSGRVIQTKYTCPTNSLFNPKKQLCDVEYTCPCQSEITSASTVQTTDNEVVTKEDSTVTQSVTTEETNSESTTDELTTSSENSNSSTDKETTQENSTSESTTSPSRTPSTGHITATASDVFNGTETSPTTSFDECAYNADTSDFICTEKGRFRNANDKTCQTYFLCNILSSGRVIQTKYTCPTNSLFNPIKQLCDAEYTCPCQSEITSASTVQTTDNEVVTKEDSTVTQSVTTEVTDSESTTDELTTSSENSNSSTDKETTQENSTSESTTSPSRTPSTGHNTATASDVFNGTETSPTTSFDECAYNADTSYFICTEKGRFRNANDKTCQTYFLCNILSSGRVIQTKYTCPTNSLFNPKKKLCDVEYTCPCQSEITSASTVQTTDNEVVTKEDSTVTQSVTTEVTNSESTTDELTTSYENSNSSTDKETTQENSTTESTTSHSRTPSTMHNTATASDVFNGTETSPTTSFDECSYNADTSYFICTEKGRFRNANDKTCQTYFLCNILSSGRVIQTKYTCPTNSLFNPKKKLCDVEYTCPCQSEISSASTVQTTDNEVVTKEDSTVTQSVTTEDTNSKSTTDELTTSSENSNSSTDKETTQENSTSESTTSPSRTPSTGYNTATASDVFNGTEKSPTTSFDECAYNADTSYFICTEKGRFRNANDKTCQTYFLCNILSSGRVIQTKYTCPTNSLFNPKKKLCDVEYTCPCQSEITSASTVQTTDNEVVTKEDSTVTQSVTTEETNSESTTDELTTSSENSNSSIDKETTQENSTSESTTSPSRTPSTGHNTATASDVFNGTETSPTTSFDECAYNADTSYFICTEKGRFRNANDKTCQTYFLCNILSSGRVIQTKYTCPTNSLFNPIKQLCDAEYTCPCQSEITSAITDQTTDNEVVTKEDSTISQSVTTEVTDSESTTDELTTSSDNSNSSTDKETTQENSTSESTTSPSRTPSTGHNTATPSDVFNGTETSPTTSFDECAYNADTSYFICTEKGRFRNANDKTCQTYFLCNILTSGRVIQTKYTCPTNSLFNPIKQLCDDEYTCPCESEITSASTVQTTDNEVVTKEDSTITQSVTTEVTNSESTTDELTTSSENSNSSTDKETTQENSTSESTTSPSRTPSTGHNTATASEAFNGTETSPTTNFDECAYNADTSNFICTEKGRFRNANDKTCQTYFLCNILSSGRVIQTKYTCPTNSLFNPIKQLCDAEYTCPCQSEITSASTDQTTDNEVVTKEDSTITQSVTTEVTNSESTTDELTTSSENSNSSTDKETTQENSTTESTTSHSRTPSTMHNTATASDVFNGTETSPTTSFDECSYNADTSYFICTEKGRFRNANDKTCQTYFLCNILSSGRVIQTKYTCPTNSLFNPKKKLCDVEYTCPCQSEISSASTVQTTDNEVVTKEDSTVTQSVTTEDTNSKSTTDELTTSSENSNSSTDKETTQENSTSESTTSPSRTPSTGYNTATASDVFNGTEKSPTTSFDECAYNADTSYFICTEKGRFRNANDKTCQTYFLCNILSSGRVIQTKYTCPTNSLFNPKKKLCDVEYTCPCQSEITSASTVQTTDNEVVTKEDSTVTQSVTTEETNSESTTDELTTSSENSNSSIDKETTQENSTSESTTSPSRTPSTGHNTATASDVFNGTETSPTTSFDECAYNADTSYFICTEKGRFRNANDKTCQTYFLCNILSSGRVIQTKYTCPTNSLFNPIKQLCDAEYTCPCQSEITSAITDQTTDNEVVTKEDSTISQSVTTEVTDSESTTDELTTSSDNSNSSTDKETTQENSTSESTTSPSRTPSTGHNTATPSDVFNGTETSPTTSFDECAYNADTSYFICTEKGRFRNANDKTCQTYFLCNILTSGRVIQTKYTCPTNSLFNPIKQLCDDEYTCPCESEITSASTVQTTDNEVVTKEDSTITQSVTTEVTNSESTTDELTTSSENSNSSTDKETTQENSTSESTTSPSRTPSTGHNTATASEAFNGTETSPTTNFDECAYNADTSNFICTEKGRFRNANDKTCQTYFLCNILSSGRVIQTKYTCPTNSLFNPIKQLCDAEYTCPCQSEITSASTDQTTDNEVVTKEDSTITQSVTTEVTNSESTTDELTTSSENSNSSTDKEATQESSTSESTTSPSRTPSTGHNTATASEAFNGTETSPTTSFDECAYNADTSNFICTEKGRFRNANDKTCQTYFLCNMLSSGRVIQTKYTCPTNSLFNPIKQLCDAEYTCPCQSEITSASTDQTTDNEVVTKEDSTISQSFTTEVTDLESTTDELTTSSDNSNSSTDKEPTQENSTSESTTSPSRTPSTGHNTATASEAFNGTETSPTTSFDECAYNADTSNFICTEKGRFRNANDKTCQTYFLCNILSSGRVIQTKYTCPTNSLFNPIKQLCDAEYKCSCLS